MTQKHSSCVPFMFHNFSNYDRHLFFKTLIDKKSNIVPLHVILMTNAEYISISYGCFRFIDSYRLSKSSLDWLVKTIDELSPQKRDFPGKWQPLNTKLAYPYENFKSLDDYDLPNTIVVKEDYFFRLKNGYPENSEIERKDNNIESFNIKTKRQVTELY